MAGHGVVHAQIRVSVLANIVAADENDEAAARRHRVVPAEEIVGGASCHEGREVLVGEAHGGRRSRVDQRDKGLAAVVPAPVATGVGEEDPRRHDAGHGSLSDEGSVRDFTAEGLVDGGVADDGSGVGACSDRQQEVRR